jgi:membrane-associated phospholipid phosphatase
VRRSTLCAAAGVIGFAVLAVLVASGGLTGIDGWAVRHAMPGLDPSEASLPLVYGLAPLAGLFDETPIQVAVNVATAPAGVVLSGLIVTGAAIVLHRRGENTAALAWLGAWLAANAIEVLTKTVLERPGLSHAGVRVTDFDHSFPSGHAARGLLAAAVCALVWPRARALAALWAAFLLPALVVAGFHTPSDVAGGAVLASLLAAAAFAISLGERSTGRVGTR